MKQPLSKLERVSARKVWKRETHVFKFRLT